MDPELHTKHYRNCIYEDVEKDSKHFALMSEKIPKF